MIESLKKTLADLQRACDRHDDEEMGITSVYLSMIMNGKKKVRDENRMKSRVFDAIEAIEKKRQETNHGTDTTGIVARRDEA